MDSKLLKGLENGLKLLKNQMKERKDVIVAKLNWKEKVSSDNEKWLDNEGNTVDEDRVADVLKRAHTPERILNEMDAADKEVMRKLRKLGGDIPKLAGNQHKCKCLIVSNLVEAEELQGQIMKRCWSSPRFLWLIPTWRQKLMGLWNQMGKCKMQPLSNRLWFSTGTMPIEGISQLWSTIFDVSQNIATSVSISHCSQNGWKMRWNDMRNSGMWLHMSNLQSASSKLSSLMSPRWWISGLQRLAMKEFSSQVTFSGLQCFAYFMTVGLSKIHYIILTDLKKLSILMS